MRLKEQRNFIKEMKLIDKISWSDGRIEGDVFQMMVKKNDNQNLESSFPRFDPSKYI